MPETKESNRFITTKNVCDILNIKLLNKKLQVNMCKSIDHSKFVWMKNYDCGYQKIITT